MSKNRWAKSRLENWTSKWGTRIGWLYMKLHDSKIMKLKEKWLKILPAASFTSLPLSMISFHLLQIRRALQISIKWSSLSILSTISGGKLLKLTDSLIVFASDILNVCFRRNLQAFWKYFVWYYSCFDQTELRANIFIRQNKSWKTITTSYLRNI